MRQASRNDRPTPAPAESTPSAAVQRFPSGAGPCAWHGSAGSRSVTLRTSATFSPPIADVGAPTRGAPPAAAAARNASHGLTWSAPPVARAHAWSAMRVEGGPVGAHFAPHVACCAPWVACCMVHVACRALCVACCTVHGACCVPWVAHASAGRAAGGPVGAEADEKSSGLPAPSGAAAKGLGRRGSVMGPMALRAVSLAWFVRAFSSSSCTRTNGRCEERRRCDQSNRSPADRLALACREREAVTPK